MGEEEYRRAVEAADEEDLSVGDTSPIPSFQRVLSAC